MHDEALRHRLLERAGRMVAERGVSALTLRAVAADVGTSTSAVYSLFGGKPDLLNALFRWAFAGFGTAQHEVAASDDPLADLHALGLAYRQWALEHPHLYAVMFGGALAGFEPDPAAEQESRATMQPLAATVRRGLDRGLLGHADAETIAFAVWAAVHGLVSLELTTGLHVQPRAERDLIYDVALRGIARGWQA